MRKLLAIALLAGLTSCATGKSHGRVGTDIYFPPQAGGGGTATLRNNIWYQGTTNCASAFAINAQPGSGTIVQDHNLGYAPNCSSTWTGAPTGTGVVIGNPLFNSLTMWTGFRPGSTSPARNAGSLTAPPVWSDQVLVPRPQGPGTVPTIGAYEFVP